MSYYYTNITTYQYVVPDFYCLPYLAVRKLSLILKITDRIASDRVEEQQLENVKMCRTMEIALSRQRQDLRLR